MTKKFIPIWGGLIVALVLAWIVSPNLGYSQRAMDRARDAEVKQNLYNIAAAIERYSMDTKEFPEDIAVLVAEDYLDEFPLNPYSHTYLETHHHSRPMKAVKLEDRDVLGDFVYLPIFRENNVIGYYLLAISESDTRRAKPEDFAWQHISLCLRNVDPPGASR